MSLAAVAENLDATARCVDCKQRYSAHVPLRRLLIGDMICVNCEEARVNRELQRFDELDRDAGVSTSGEEIEHFLNEMQWHQQAQRALVKSSSTHIGGKLFKIKQNLSELRDAMMNYKRIIADKCATIREIINWNFQRSHNEVNKQKHCLLTELVAYRKHTLEASSCHKELALMTFNERVASFQSDLHKQQLCVNDSNTDLSQLLQIGTELDRFSDFLNDQAKHLHRALFNDRIVHFTATSCSVKCLSDDTTAVPFSYVTPGFLTFEPVDSTKKSETEAPKFSGGEVLPQLLSRMFRVPTHRVLVHSVHLTANDSHFLLFSRVLDNTNDHEHAPHFLLQLYNIHDNELVKTRKICNARNVLVATSAQAVVVCNVTDTQVFELTMYNTHLAYVCSNEIAADSQPQCIFVTDTHVFVKLDNNVTTSRVMFKVVDVNLNMGTLSCLNCESENTQSGFYVHNNILYLSARCLFGTRIDIFSLNEDMNMVESKHTVYIYHFIDKFVVDNVGLLVFMAHGAFVRHDLVSDVEVTRTAIDISNSHVRVEYANLWCMMRNGEFLAISPAFCSL